MSFTRASSIVYKDLQDHESLTTLLSKGKESVYPLLASETEADNFVNYYIQDTGKASKEASRFEVVVRSYAESYDLCCQIADKVTESFKASNNYYTNLGGRPYANGEGWFYIEQKFTIKI